MYVDKQLSLSLHGGQTLILTCTCKPSQCSLSAAPHIKKIVIICDIIVHDWGLLRVSGWRL